MQQSHAIRECKLFTSSSSEDTSSNAARDEAQSYTNCNPKIIHSQFTDYLASNQVDWSIP